MAKAGPKPGTFAVGDPRINRTKPGPGRPTDKARAEWLALAKTGRATLRKAKILNNAEHPLFAFALKHSTEHGEGKPAQPIVGPEGGPVEITVTRRIVSGADD